MNKRRTCSRAEEHLTCLYCTTTWALLCYPDFPGLEVTGEPGLARGQGLSAHHNGLEENLPTNLPETLNRNGSALLCSW